MNSPTPPLLPPPPPASPSSAKNDLAVGEMLLGCFIGLIMLSILIHMCFRTFCCFVGSQHPTTSRQAAVQDGGPTRLQRFRKLYIALSGPVVEYKDQERVKESKSYRSDCAICLEDFKNGDACRILYRCKHMYHLDCIDPWLMKDRHCPLCRGSVRGSVRGATRSNDVQIPQNEA